MLNELVSWWVRQMLDLVPSRWRFRAAGPANAVVVDWRGRSAQGGGELLVRRDHRETALGPFKADEPGLRAAQALLGARRAAATVLRLPAGFVLERQISLPLAAEQGLDRVVRYEMDRFTPFAAEEVVWSCTVQRRDRAQGKLAAAIALVPRARLQPVLDTLAQIQIRPTVLEAPGPDGALRLIALAPPDLRRLRWQRRGLAAAAAGCAALALAAILEPFIAQSAARDAVDARIAALAPRVKQTEALRDKLNASSAGSDVVAAERARVGDALRAIAALTDLLHDDTYLIGLVLRQREVTLEGQSAAATKLIASLSSSPDIRNASFSAPVTRNETGADLFSIKAEVAH